MTSLNKKMRQAGCAVLLSVLCVYAGENKIAPTVIQENQEWVALDYEKNILPGSALDFSNQGLQDAPAGKYGWLQNRNGHFVFEKAPHKPVRFYGVNLCYGANYLEHAHADELVTRLVRLGYNTVRIHHYEAGLVGEAGTHSFNTNALDRLDYLLAKLYEKGLYVTTDLFVSRPVPFRAIGIDREGLIPQQIYKSLVALYEPAFEDFKRFSEKLLTHVNPYTKRAWKDEPGLPLLSLVNENAMAWDWHGNQTKKILGLSELACVQEAWTQWLKASRTNKPDFLADAPQAVQHVMPWQHGEAFVRFSSEKEAALVMRTHDFLKKLGVKALLTNQNSDMGLTAMNVVREACYDYVDDHFYVDHPEFIERTWKLPSRCSNKNPVLSKDSPVTRKAWNRLATKPFVMTEWNFSGPGMYRGVGGLMTGTMAALQDWDGLWRFAYAHGSWTMASRAGFPTYFDVSSDPLSQMSDRASICLFLRGDLSPIKQGVVQEIRRMDCFEKGKASKIYPAWREAAWTMRVATDSVPAPTNWTSCAFSQTHTNREPPVVAVENKAVQLDRKRGSFCVNTPRTAGGFAPSGVLQAGPLTCDVGSVSASVWVSSLDGKAIEESSRLVLFHLTDVQGKGTTFADPAKTILLKWGSYPPLVRAGEAPLSIAFKNPQGLHVWALDTAGRRLAEVPSQITDKGFSFTASIKGPKGACLAYEISR